MKTISMLLVLILFTSINAQAGEWILWQHQSVSGEATNQPIPRTEHKTLTACLDASKKVADSIHSLQKYNDIFDRESVTRIVDPDGVSYKSKDGKYFFHIQTRCYPYGVVPMAANFTPSQ